MPLEHGERPLEHGERVTILCMVLQWHRRTMLRLASAVLRRIVARRMFRSWLQGAARQQDQQIAERMELEMGLPPNALGFADAGEPIPSFLHFNPYVTHFTPP